MHEHVDGPAQGSEAASIVGGTLVGGTYEILAPIDSGAVGVIYEARQVHLGRKVAIKLLREPFAGSAEFMGSLLREARAGCLIDHPNVARTIDVGRDEAGRCFIVMELLHGKSLVRVIETVCQPPLEWTLSIIAQMLAGLSAAHARGVVHRDIKPENVIIQTMLDDDGLPIDVAKICDFGIAAVPGSDILDEQGRPITFQGKLCGTPNYMSPEQAQALPLDRRTDLYSCGVVLFELLTGRLPFYDSTVLGLADMHARTPPPRPRDLCPDIEPELERIVLRALHKRPEQRYPSARAMRAELLGLPAARPSTPPLGMVRELNGTASPYARGMRLEQTVLTDITRRGRRRLRRQLAAAIVACFLLISASIAVGMRTRMSNVSAHPVAPAPAAAQQPLDLTTGAAESAASESRGPE